MWTKQFMQEFKKAFARAGNERKLWWEMICTQNGQQEDEWGLPLIRTGQGRNKDYYDPKQVNSSQVKIGTKKW